MWKVEQYGRQWGIERNGRRLPGETFGNRNEALKRLREIRGPAAKPLETEPDTSLAPRFLQAQKQAVSTAKAKKKGA